MPKSLYDILAAPNEPTPQIIGRGLLPVKGKMVIAGQPKTNKSWIAMNLGLALAKNRLVFDAKYDDHGVPKPAFPIYGQSKVLYFDMEVGEQGIRDRCAGGLASVESVYNVPFDMATRDVRFKTDSQEGRELIEAEIEKSRPQVLILDPMSKFHSANENDAMEIGRVLSFGDHLCDKYKLSIIWLHHTAKPPQDPNAIRREGGDMIRGSSAIFADADTVAIVTRLSSKFAVNPVCELRFELRRGEPLRRQYIQRHESGVITYLGEGKAGRDAVARAKVTVDQTKNDEDY